ncbi:MAG: glycosyltransferase family 1 protein, partial [Gammaproteobacteria bacterium]|nr:glycosyltransferase family 1 protein [Gammaproteobacteria bacterium]
NKVHKNEPTLHREDGKNREDALLALAQASEKNQWKFALFGFGWEKHPFLSQYASGQIDNKKMVELYQKAKIVFNPAWSNDETPKPQCKLRHFEVAGTGSFQLTNANKELSQLFEENKEICFYNNNDDLVTKIQYYLDNEQEREAIAKQGYYKAIQEHTLDNRAEQLFTTLKQKYHLQTIKTVKQVHIKQIFIKNYQQLKFELVQLKIDNNLHTYQAIHFLCGKLNVERVEYTALIHLLNDPKINLIAVRSFIESNDSSENWMQPSTEEIDGCFIKEAFLWHEIPQQLKPCIKNSLIYLENKTQNFLLSNFIVKPKSVIKFVDAFIKQNPSELLDLNPIYSGVQSNHLIFSKNASDSISNTESQSLLYLKLLSNYLTRSRHQSKIAVYGALGLMAENTLEYIFTHLPNNLSAIIDNGMAGKILNGYTIQSHQALDTIKPDIIIIAASVSGPEIYESLKLTRAKFLLLPLYDIKHPIWDIITL